MAGRMRKQRSEADHGRKVSLIRFIIGALLILLATALLILWGLNSMGFIQRPWSALLATIFNNIYTFIITVGALIIGIISANNKEVFQKFFPHSTTRAATSEAIDEDTSISTTTPSVTTASPRSQDPIQPQHLGKSVSGESETGGFQESVRIEIIKPDPLFTISREPGSIFLFNEHLPHPGEFYGRKLESEGLINRVRKSASTSIVGSRRIGKTWLIEYLMQVVSTKLGPNYRIGYVDATLPGCETVSGFVTSALEQIGIRITPRNAYTNLRILLEVLDKLKANNLIPILCIDEFEGLDNRQEFDQEFFSGLRAVCQRGLGLVTVSQRTLFDIVGNDGYTSGFFNIFDTYMLVPFDEKEAKEFVQAKGEQAKLTRRERLNLLNYAGQQTRDKQGWPPLRLQLTGKMLLEEKSEGNLRPNDSDYWRDFMERLEKRYQMVVH